MTKKEDKLIEHLEGLFIKMNQSGKAEVSGLAGDLRKDIAVIHEHNKHTRTTLEEIKEQTTKTNGKVMLNTEYRLRTTGSINAILVLAGIGGLSGIISFIRSVL